MESVIIFLTGHEELGMTILKDELFFLTFINKYDNYQYRLNRAIKKALTILGNKKMLKFTDNNCIYIIAINEIIYISKDKTSRKTTIVTDDNNKAQKNVIEIKKNATGSDEITISEFSTKIYNKEEARQTNVKITCDKLNGIIVNSGNEFSFEEIVGKATTEKRL